MTAAVLVTANFPALSGRLEDTVVNDFVFFNSQALDFTSTELDTIGQDVINFYNSTLHTPALPLAQWMSSTISRANNACYLQFFDIEDHLDGSPHGSPIKTVTFKVADMGAGFTNLPSEVAVVLTVKGTFAGVPEFGPGTRPRSRRRGRIYFGPLVTGIIALEATTNRPFVTLTLRDILTQSGNNLMNAPGHVWGVWSRADASIHTITGGWVDDAFDTQRRRGQDPLIKTSFGSLALFENDVLPVDARGNVFDVSGQLVSFHSR